MLKSTCMSATHSGSVVKVNSDTNTSSNLNSLYNTHLRWIRANRDMPFFRGQASFNYWATTQKELQLDNKVITGYVILPLQQKKFLCKCVCLSHCNLLYIHL